MSIASVSRRRMLAAIAAAGGIGRMAPFLPSALRAAEAPKRILTVFKPMGYLEKSFWPTPMGDSFTLGQTMTPLEPYKNKLIFLDGLYMYGAPWFFQGNDDNEHGNGGTICFTGSKKQNYATGPSVDQAVADHLFAQTKTKFRSYGLGVNGGGSYDHHAVFFSKAHTPVIAQQSPAAAFDTLFKGFTAPSSAPVDTSAMDCLRKQKQSVLDAIKDDVKRICQDAGREAKEKCEAHLEGLAMVENRVRLETEPGATVGAGCAQPASVKGANVGEQIRSQMDLVASAFACDLTRSMSLQLGHCDGGIDIFPDLNLHGITHSSGPSPSASTLEDHRKLDKWFAEQFAYLLGKLDGIKEGNGTLLDNTLVVFGTDTTTGETQEKGAHQHWRFPMFLAGGGNFAFKTGRYIKLPLPTQNHIQSQALAAKCVTTQRLLTSICQAFGMSNESFGTWDAGKGTIAELTRAG